MTWLCIVAHDVGEGRLTFFLRGERDAPVLIP